MPGADSAHHKFGICYQNESQTSREIPKRENIVRERKIKDITKALWHKQAQEIETITYGRAIAEVAKQIQYEEYPTFDSIFVMFGGFHVDQNVF